MPPRWLVLAFSAVWSSLNGASAEARVLPQYSAKQIAEAHRDILALKPERRDLYIIEDLDDRSFNASLKAAFKLPQQDDVKGKLASILVEFGDDDPVLRAFLLGRAEQAVRCDAEDPDGVKATEEAPAPGFVDWARKKHLSIPDALNLVAVSYPLAIFDLAESGDRGAIPILRQGLRSHQQMILLASANALSDLHDEESVTSIIALVDRSPTSFAKQLAVVLVFFDDQKAQATALRVLGADSYAVFRGRALAGYNAIGR